MSNLIQELSVDYCNQMMHGAYLKVGDDVHWWNTIAEPGVVRTIKLSGNPDKVSPKNDTVPWEFFKGWSAFAYPVLGYRMACNGKVLVYLTRNNSVRRGLSNRDVGTTFHDVTYSCVQQFGIDIHHYMEDTTKACLVMNPTYMSLTKGLKEVMDGNIPAFAISADFAVAPHDTVPFLEILFRQRQIGTISENGTIEFMADSILPSWQAAVADGEKKHG